MYVVGLRVTGLVITTIPAIVLRPDPPTTGLNTSLTDPHGQWTATAAAKIIEKNDTYWVAAHQAEQRVQEPLRLAKR